MVYRVLRRAGGRGYGVPLRQSDRESKANLALEASKQAAHSDAASIAIRAPYISSHPANALNESRKFLLSDQV